MKTVGEYIAFLQGKGFKLKEDAISFIFFGKQYTKAPDSQVNLALEWTLKTKRSFDGSFYLNLLERFVEEEITSEREVEDFIKRTGLLTH